MARSELLTIAQAAARLGLAPSTLSRQAHDGRIAAVRPGHDWLVEAEEVDRYGREQRRPTGPTHAAPAQKSGFSRALSTPPDVRKTASKSAKTVGSGFSRGVLPSPDERKSLKESEPSFGVARPAPKPRKK